MKRRFGLDDMTLRGFDSFEGMPPSSRRDPLVWHAGEYACGEAELRGILDRHGFRADEYELVPGFYESSLNDPLRRRLAGRQAAIVYIDCDLYESALCVLNFIGPMLVQGSIVCFDDYYCYAGSARHGEQRALREFLAGRQDLAFTPYMLYAPMGQSFIVQNVSASTEP